MVDSDNNGNVGNVGGGGSGNIGAGGVPQMDQMGGGGFVQQSMPGYRPQMDMTPITNGAVDPMQG